MMSSSRTAALLISGSLFVAIGAHAQTASNQHAVNPAHRAVQTRPDAQHKILLEAKALIDSGKPADAYALLEPFEFERSGEVGFDYLLGVAALDSGKPDKATLAFERVLTVNPDFAGARMDMARAYYQLGDLQRARAEFQIVLQQNPPQAARVTIKEYLDEISGRLSPQRTRISGYVAGTIGHDSNVNNSTSLSQISIPALPGSLATLNPANVKAPDNYLGVAAGSEITHSLDDKWGLYAGADLLQRAYNRQTGFNSVDLGGRTGVMFGTEANRWRAGISGEISSLGNTRNFNAVGLNTEWLHCVSPGDQLSLFGQYLQYRFAQIAMQVNDFNQQVIGAGWQHALAGGRSTVAGSLYYGYENDISNIVTSATPNGGRIDGPMHFTGLRIGAQTSVNDTVSLFANATAQSGNYSRTNRYFLTQRTDRLTKAVLGVDWRWRKYWNLRPQLAYTHANSNIVVYSYNRTDVSLTLRRDFQ
jgi:tetratricopeptide (TPR) repeat protein